MAVAKITGQGLSAIAVLVVLLWTCIIGERLLMRSAHSDMSQVLRENRKLQLRRHVQPAVSPKLKLPRPARPTVS